MAPASTPTLPASLEQAFIDALPDFPRRGEPLNMVKGVPAGPGSEQARAYARTIELCLARGSIARGAQVEVGGEAMPFGVALCLGRNICVAQWALQTADTEEWNWRDGEGHGLPARMALTRAEPWRLYPAIEAAPTATLEDDMPTLVRCAARRASLDKIFIETLERRGYAASEPRWRAILREQPGRDGLLQLLASSTLDEPLDEPVKAGPEAVSRLGRGVLPLWWAGVSAPSLHDERQRGILGHDDLLRGAAVDAASPVAREAVAWLLLMRAGSKASIAQAMRRLPAGDATLDPEGRPALWHALIQNGGVFERIQSAEREHGQGMTPLMARRGHDGCGFWAFVMEHGRLGEILDHATPFVGQRGQAEGLVQPGEEGCPDGCGAAAHLLLADRLADNNPSGLTMTGGTTGGARRLLLADAGWRLDGVWAAPGEALARLRTLLFEAGDSLLTDWRIGAPDSDRASARTRAASSLAVLGHACGGEGFARLPELARCAGPLGFAMLARMVMGAGHPAFVNTACDEGKPVDFARTTRALLRAALLAGDRETQARMQAAQTGIADVRAAVGNTDAYGFHNLDEAEAIAREMGGLAATVQQRDLLVKTARPGRRARA